LDGSAVTRTIFRGFLETFSAITNSENDGVISGKTDAGGGPGGGCTVRGAKSGSTWNPGGGPAGGFGVFCTAGSGEMTACGGGPGGGFGTLGAESTGA
jgi:hypothetical protein